MLLLLAIVASARAEVTWIEAPSHMRLYPRDAGSDSASVRIAGSLDGERQMFESIRVRVLRDARLVASLQQDLIYQDGKARFDLSTSIKAELANHRFEIHGLGGATATLVLAADSVVAGEVVVIQGQSNAEACKRGAEFSNAIQSPFIRVFGNGSESFPLDRKWRRGDGDVCSQGDGGTGQWGLRFARDVVDSSKMPVAIFNGAKGASGIGFFRRNPADHADSATNYGRMLLRLTESGVLAGVRTLVWYQGEHNAKEGMSTSAYREEFLVLKSQWTEDIPSLRRFYVFQIRNGCQASLSETEAIQEAQRSVAADFPEVGIMSTSAQIQLSDSCHYGYKGGYEAAGRNLYRIYARDVLSRSSVDDIDAPFVRFAVRSGANEITLRLGNPVDFVQWVSGSEGLFSLVGGGPVISGSSGSGRIALTTSGTLSSASTLGVRGRVPEPDPVVLNRNGVGMVHFQGMRVVAPGEMDSSVVAAMLRANGSSSTVGKVATSGSDGRITRLDLRGHGLGFLPADLFLLDSLVSLDLRENRLAALPREISALAARARIRIDGNRLCSLSTAQRVWIDSRTDAVDWLSTQQCGANSMRPGAAVSSTDVVRVVRTTAGYRVRFQSREPGRTIEVVRPDGRIILSETALEAEAFVSASRLQGSILILNVSRYGQKKQSLLLPPVILTTSP